MQNSQNFFDNYLPKTEEFHLESAGVTVKLRKLSYAESQKIGNESISGIDKDGEPIINFEEANLAKLKKISAALVEPKMTVKQLSALSDEADDVIDELYKLVDPKTYEAVEKAKKAQG